MDIRMKKNVCLLITSYTALLIFMILVIKGKNTLYADGSHHLMDMMLNPDHWYEYYNHRAGAMFLQYGFAFLALKVGVTSVKTLIDLCSFGYSFWIMFFYAASLTACYHKKNFKLMYLGILYFCFVLINSGFMPMISSNITASWFWCCFVYIYLYSSTSPKEEIFILLLSSIGIYINEYTIFLNIILLILVFSKKKQSELIFSKWWYFTLFALFAGFVRGFDGTFIHQDIDPGGDLLNCVKIPVPLLWSQIISLALLLILLLISCKYSSVMISNLLEFSVFVVCFVCIWRIVQGVNVISYMSNIVRIYNLVIPIMLGCYLILERKMKVNIQEKYLALPAATFLVCFLIYYSIATNDFQIYGSNTAQYCKDHEGFVARTELNYDWAYNWGWTAAEESILLQAYYGNQNVNCIITDGEDDVAVADVNIFYEKYDALHKYNIYINHDLLK